MKLKIETAGIESGKPVAFEIWQKDINRGDRKIHEISNIDVSGDAAEAEWVYRYADYAEEGSAAPGGYSKSGYSRSITPANSR